jgi:superfamily II DNA or RNA helicase
MPPGAPNGGIQDLYRLLAADPNRNRLIAADAVAMINDGRSPLILTARRDHLERLAKALAPQVEQLCVLHGGLRPTQRRAAIESLAAQTGPTAILATGRYLGEGFDHPPLDTLLLALPVAWKGAITQYAGRLNRPAPGKHEARIYAYVDRDVPMLAAMFTKRERAYRTLGYQSEVADAVHIDDTPDPNQIVLIDTPNL